MWCDSCSTLSTGVGRQPETESLQGTKMSLGGPASLLELAKAPQALVFTEEQCPLISGTVCPMWSPLQGALTHVTLLKLTKQENRTKSKKGREEEQGEGRARFLQVTSFPQLRAGVQLSGLA